MTVRLLTGDALEMLRTLADESVHSVELAERTKRFEARWKKFKESA